MGFTLLRRKRRIRLGSYAALLLSMIAYLILASIAQEAGGRIPWITGVLFPVILFTTIGSAAETPRQLGGLLALGVVVFAVDMLNLQAPAHWVQVLAHLVHILFLILTILLILRHVFRDVAVGADMILGAVCAYLLIGFTFNQIYSLVDTLQPDSFKGGISVQQDGGYFSLVTLSTLGYGDMVPVRGLARSIAALEAVVGQLYIAVIVARLVGLHMIHARPRSDAEPQSQG